MWYKTNLRFIFIYFTAVSNLAQLSDVNKATSHKAKAKARDLKAKAKAKDFQHSPRPGQGQGRVKGRHL